MLRRAKGSDHASAHARESCPGGRASSAEGLEHFARCSRIDGSLYVDSIASLEPLSALRSVSGTLAVQNTRELESLSGLDRLESVGDLVLFANHALDDISALSTLRSATSVEISENPRLRDLEGLAGVVGLERLSLRDNGLRSTRGLERLTRVTELSISDHPWLISVGSLNGLTRVERVVIERNPRLTGFYGLFDGLESPPSSAKFTNNAGLSAADRARLEARSRLAFR